MKSLRIGIDAHLLTYRRGIGNCVYNLLVELAKLPAPHHYFLYVNDSKASAHIPDDPRFHVRVLKPKFIPYWEQVALPRAAQQDRLDLLHCTANTGPLALPSRLPLLLTIHDVIYMLPRSDAPPASPSLYQRLGRRYYKAVTSRAARRAAAATTVSEFSRRDIVKYLGMDAEKVRVVSNAPNGDCRVLADRDECVPILQRLGLQSPYIMAVGAVDPRKNTARVIEAYAHLRRESALSHRLLLCGLNAAGKAQFQPLAASLDIAEDVIMAGFVSTEELIALYNAADLFVYPTLYEGFGIPVVEAMACGTPVLTSPVTSIPEVGGEAVLYADPLSVESIAQGMRKLLSENELRARLADAGLEQAAQFSWHKSARELLELYEATASGQ